MTLTDKQHQEDLQRLRLLRPIDDDLCVVFLRITFHWLNLCYALSLIKPDLIITECETQKDMKRLAGARSICLDAYGTDLVGKNMI